MEILSITEGVNNPRPEFLEAHKQGKFFIAHLVDENSRISKCGKAKFISGIYKQDGESIGIESFEGLSEQHWLNRSLICPKCKE